MAGIVKRSLRQASENQICEYEETQKVTIAKGLS